MRRLRAALLAALVLTSVKAMAADYPAPKQGDWIAKDFKFHTGQIMPELKLHYTTVGEPTGQPALVLHGSGGSAATMLTPTFAGELFGSVPAHDGHQVIPETTAIALGVRRPHATSDINRIATMSV